MDLTAVFSEEGMALLKKGIVRISSGGLRYANGPMKGRMYEMAELVLQNTENSDPQIHNSVAAALEKVATQYQAHKKDTVKTLNDLNRIAANTQMLGGINVALSFANTAITAAGFAVVCRKLDTMKSSIKHIDTKIDALYRDMSFTRQKDSYRSYLRKMRDDLFAFDECHAENTQAEYYQRHDQSIPNLLGDVGDFLDQVREWFISGKMTTERGELGCEILFSLLPLYSSEIIEACQCHVRLHGKLPGQYSLWLEPLVALSEEAFQKGLKEYLIFAYPTLSPLQKADLYETMNVVISNILKAQINNGKICEFMATEGAASFDDLKIEAIGVNDFEKSLTLTNAL